MRWDNLRLDSADDAGDGQVPMFARDAVVRTFDTPGFRGMTFYEVQAKSIVSRVPDSSRMPFRWTINPYRGCQHACRYCQSGDTRILMANGTTKALAEVEVGDAIYGTVRDGWYRRYAITEVLAHWSTVKPAYRITLEDGTKLVASGDHRFLTERGWKHVTGAEQGPDQRPFLTVNNKMMGFGGGSVEPAKDSVEYRRGYLCGIIRGVGRPLRLARTDAEALNRIRDFLGSFGTSTDEFERDARVVEHLIGWPQDPGRDWMCGFLAGVFDAQGRHSRGIWRVAVADSEVVRWTTRALEVLGFGYDLEPELSIAPSTPIERVDCAIDRHLVVVRLRVGLREVMRFFHTTEPAITRKRSIEGVALKSDAKLRVASIEPLGIELPMYDITTGTGDFIANGVVSHNCFARNSHTYLDLDAGRDFDSKVVVKVNAPELLRKKLASPGWPREHIAMGTNVDCYQRAEGRYQLMRGIIAALRDAANPFSILTKGTLILRDLDLLLEAAEVTDVGLNVSAAFLDTSLWRAIEPGTPAPERRLEACAALNDNGLGCGVLMGPVVPFLSDSPAQLDAAVRQIAAAGATHVSPIVLHLRPGTREWFLGWLRSAHPELTGKYAALYDRGAYAPRDYQARISGQVRELADKYGVGRGSPRQIARRSVPAGAVRPVAPVGPPAPQAPVAPPAPAPASPEQLTLL
jgi:DNA repair photolyase